MKTLVVDPVITGVVQGYGVPTNVGHELFPVVPVQTRTGQIIMFTDRDFMTYNTARARGAATKRVNFGYKGNNFKLENHSLEAAITREDLQDAEQQAPNLKLIVRSVRKVMRIIALGLEADQAQTARNADNYPATNKKVLSGTSQWSDDASNPAADIEDAVEAIRRQTGVEPNKLVLGASVFKALKNHPKIRAACKITADGKVITAEMLANLFDIEKVVVGKAVVYNEKTEQIDDVWGNDAILAYVPSNADLDNETPSYGFTYRLENHPFAEKGYYDNNTKTHYYPVTDERMPVIAGIFAGYLFKDAVA